MSAHDPLLQRGRLQVGGRDQSARIVFWLGNAVLGTGDRVHAKRVLLTSLSAIEPLRLVPLVEDEGRIGRVREGHPRQDAPVLRRLRASRQLERGKVGGGADRPADHIGSDNAPGDRLSRDLLSNQPFKVERSLAMARKDDGRVLRNVLDELIESGGHVGIGEIECLLGIGAV